MSEIRTIGGRAWRVVDPRSMTIEHDNYFERAIRAAGLHKLKPGKPASEGEAEQLIVRAYEAIADTNQTLIFLGGLLLPEETPDQAWDRQQAKETVEFLRPLTALDDRMAMRHAIVLFLADFFVDGLLSSALSRTASGTPAEKQPAANANACAPLS